MDHKLSETEQYLWDYIESHILEVPNYSIVKLSEQANVSTATIVRTMKKKGYEGFTAFKHHLKEQENKNIEDAIQKIKFADRVFLFARGFSEMIGQEMMVKFQLTGKNCQMHTDPEIIKNISRKLTKQDIVIFISLNGETKELVVAAKNCYDAEIGSILLTANNTSSLMNYCEIALVGFKSEGSYFPDYEVRSRLPLQIIARILLDSYALRVTDN